MVETLSIPTVRCDQCGHLVSWDDAVMGETWDEPQLLCLSCSLPPTLVRADCGHFALLADCERDDADMLVCAVCSDGYALCDHCQTLRDRAEVTADTFWCPESQGPETAHCCRECAGGRDDA